MARKGLEKTYLRAKALIFIGAPVLFPPTMFALTQEEIEVTALVGLQDGILK
jgi:hypothetical protein